MSARSPLSDAEKSALARVAIEPQSIGTLSAPDAAHLINNNMMEEVMGHYVITPKGQLELQRHVYRRAPFRNADGTSPSGENYGMQAAGSIRSAPYSKTKGSALRSFWSWLQNSRGQSGDQH